VAQFRVYEGDVVNVAAELYLQDGKASLALYPKVGGEPWEFTVADFVEAIGKGLRVLGR
jgi:hypothetical protein